MQYTYEQMKADYDYFTDPNMIPTMEGDAIYAAKFCQYTGLLMKALELACSGYERLDFYDEHCSPEYWFYEAISEREKEIQQLVEKSLNAQLS